MARRTLGASNSMKVNSMKNLIGGIVLAVALASPAVAQDARVEISKRTRAIPKSCELVTPATIEPTVDVPALIKEAICKGAGDMLGEYTYTVNSLKRKKDKKGKVKDETFVYEVFIPTLKGGMRTKGVLVVTSHNGVAVPPAELEKSRLEAAKKIEKEEERIERNAPAISESDSVTGMLPLGTYARRTLSRSSLGMKSAGATLAVADFLKLSDLTMARREQIDGRDILIFNFTPRAGIIFADNEEYMAQITGEIWIDATDRIVTRLIGWPTNAVNNKNEDRGPGAASIDKAKTSAPPNTSERPPAVYVEMMRLPKPGVWVPHVIRINGADYQTLFDGIKNDSISTYSDYIRFSTEVKDAAVEPPKNP